MKIIPLGLQCSLPEAIKQAGLRQSSYPFDWLWSPSKTTYDILCNLVHEGADAAVEYMTTGWTSYKWLGNEHYESVKDFNGSQMNATTGLGITHFLINDDYKAKLKRRLERLLADVRSGEEILLAYTDAANPQMNYHLDEVEYGVDGTEHLLKIHELLHPMNDKIKVVYFCWHERNKTGGNDVIEYVAFDYKRVWQDICPLMVRYFQNHLHRGQYSK